MRIPETKAAAAAKVACPQRATSTVGVNHRRMNLLHRGILVNKAPHKAPCAYPYTDITRDREGQGEKRGARAVQWASEHLHQGDPLEKESAIWLRLAVGKLVRGFNGMLRKST